MDAADHRSELKAHIVSVLLKQAEECGGNLDAYAYAGALVDRLAAEGYLRSADEVVEVT